MIPVTRELLGAEVGAARRSDATSAELDSSVTGLAVDSRQVVEGTLFLALPGEHVDGHDVRGRRLRRGAPRRR